MKRLLFSFALAAIMLLMAAETGNAQYYRGGQWVGANLTFGTGELGFGAVYENGMNLFDETISLGGRLRYWSWNYEVVNITVDYSIIFPEVFVNYHFQPQQQVDPFIGAALGFMVFNSDWESDDMQVNRYNEDASSSLVLTLGGGVRYFFSPKWSARGELQLLINVSGEDYGDSYSDDFLFVVGADYTL